MSSPPPDPGHTADAVLRAAEHVLAVWGPRLGPGLACLAAAAAATARRLRRRRHAALTRNARQVTINPPPDVDPEGGDVLWSNLVGLLRPHWRRLTHGQPHLAFEYAWTTAGVQISMWVPGTIPPGLIERAVEAAWPSARTQVTPARPPLPGLAAMTTGTLLPARSDDYPLRSDHPTDPLRALFGAATGLRDAETALVQILARPVTGRRLAHARRAAAHLRGGSSPRLTSRLLDLLTPGPTTSPNRQSVAQNHPERAAEIRAVLDKATHPRWAVAIRYAVTATPRGDQAAVQAELRGRAHALASAFALYTGHNHLTRHRLRHAGEVITDRRLGRGHLLSVPELAAIAHLPLDPAVPGLVRAGARVVPPPPDTPRPGPCVKPLGDSDAGIARPVGLAVTDSRHHLHVLGSNGVGKSTLLGNLVLADVQAGRGAIVIDPKGDLIIDLLSRLPATIADKTVLFDPEDPGPPPTLNLLDGADTDLTVDHLVGIFHKIFDKFWGPRTDDVLRSACLTLATQRGSTLADIPRLLGEAAFRRRVTATITDPILRGFWSWYEGLSEAHRSFVTGPIMNKLRAFLLRRFVRATVGGRASSFDMSKVLDGGLCLVRLPKGTLGEETTRLLGSFVLARAWQTATHRARTNESARRDAACYIDEAQNFLTLPHGLEDMLAEARAYRLSLVLAHQNMAQFNRELREAVSANARTKLFFAVSPEDARDLSRHVHPNLSDHDLAHLGAYQAAARLIVNGQEDAAFTLRTRPLPPPIPGRAALIRAAARTAHGGTDRTGHP